MRSVRAIRPDNAFNPFPSGFVIGEIPKQFYQGQSLMV